MVNLNKVAGGRLGPRWTMRGKPSAQPCVGGGLAGSKNAARRAALSPGPGQYTLARPEDYWCQRKPAFSFCGKVGPWPCNGVPGPGEYDAEAAALRASDRRMPTCAFGHEERLKTASQKTPGPKYDVRVRPGAGSQTRTIGEPWGDLAGSPSPGPAAYAPPRSEPSGRGSAAKWRPQSVGTLIRSRGDDAFGLVYAADNPGPGQYEDFDPPLCRKVAYTFGQHRSLPCDDTPFAALICTQFVA
mmetsp:Transcript_138219/g.440961  ORF Transcript_138219/g.440961 Transcript_138219/m.440961 type:complete len:243 (-) Transcript_138219:50-778(-)